MEFTYPRFKSNVDRLRRVSRS